MNTANDVVNLVLGVLMCVVLLVLIALLVDVFRRGGWGGWRR